MKTTHFVLLSILSAVLISCADTEPPVTDSERLTEFSKGADISWVTQMEKDGVRFYSSSGEEIECTALMKEIGFDAIRLRVWANPTGKWCDKADVLAKAKRAQKLGMDIMIDFHYSSSWADPECWATAFGSASNCASCGFGRYGCSCNLEKEVLSF